MAIREIIFRGQTRRLGEKVWRDGTRVPSNWAYGGVGHGKGAFSIIYGDMDEKLENPIEKFVVYTDTVGQYTGLCDKNGKKIFEGDICRFREWSNGDMCWFGEVHYEHQQFVISGNPNKEIGTTFTVVMSRFVPEDIEVIGNIHDNPELLRGGEEE